MDLLLDTHAFLWFITDSNNLSEKVKIEFLNPENELFFSAASYWEICIKINIGKLQLDEDWQRIFDQELVVNSIKWLEVKKEHCMKIIELPFIHRDPFDRLLISQAMYEGLTLLTADKNISKYNVNVIW